MQRLRPKVHAVARSNPVKRSEADICCCQLPQVARQLHACKKSGVAAFGPRAAKVRPSRTSRIDPSGTGWESRGTSVSLPVTQAAYLDRVVTWAKMFKRHEPEQTVVTPWRV